MFQADLKLWLAILRTKAGAANHDLLIVPASSLHRGLNRVRLELRVARGSKINRKDCGISRKASICQGCLGHCALFVLRQVSAVAMMSLKRLSKPHAEARERSPACSKPTHCNSSGPPSTLGSCVETEALSLRCQPTVQLGDLKDIGPQALCSSTDGAQFGVGRRVSNPLEDSKKQPVHPDSQNLLELQGISVPGSSTLASLASN